MAAKFLILAAAIALIAAAPAAAQDPCGAMIPVNVTEQDGTTTVTFIENHEFDCTGTPVPAATPTPTPTGPVLAYGATSARVANNPMLDHLREIATAFWRHRGVEIPDGGTTYLTDTMTGASAYTWDRDIYFPQWIVGFVQSHPFGPELAAAFCLVVFHEVGHTGKLPHSEHGVMSVTPQPGLPVESYTPWECTTWGRDRRATWVAAARARRAQRARSRVGSGSRTRAAAPAASG